MSDAGRKTQTLSLSDPRLYTILAVTGVGIVGSSPIAAILPAVGQSLSVSDAQLGLVMTAFFGASTVMVPVTGVLADVYGRRTVTILSLVTFGTAGVAVVFVDSFETLLVLRFLQGVGFAGTTPLSIVLVGDHYAGGAGSTVQGLRMSSNGFSSLVVPAAAGFLAGVAWNYPFALFVLAFPVAALVYRYLPRIENDDYDITTGVGRTLVDYASAMRTEAADRTLASLIVGGGLFFFVRYGVITFVPLFAARELDASSFEAGLLLSLIGLARVLVSPLAGPAVERTSRRAVLVAAILVVFAGTTLMALSPSFPALVVTTGIYAVGSVLFVPTLNDAVASMPSPEHRAGVVSGMNVFKNAAMAVSPAFFGAVLAVGGFPAVFFGAGIVAAGYAAIAVFTLDPEALLPA